MNYVVLSHNAFSRTELVRMRTTASMMKCGWCVNRNGRFVYGTRADDSGRVSWQRGSFCSIQCMRAFQ